jgi:hypothetical protein
MVIRSLVGCRLDQLDRCVHCLSSLIGRIDDEAEPAEIVEHHHVEGYGSGPGVIHELRRGDGGDARANDQDHVIQLGGEGRAAVASWISVGAVLSPER